MPAHLTRKPTPNLSSDYTRQMPEASGEFLLYCDHHVHDALKAGASRQEILETIGVAIVMGGKPAVVPGAVALEAVEQL